MKDVTPILLGLIALLGGGGGIWSAFNLRATRQKMIADAQKTQADTATALGTFAVEVFLDPLKTRVKELEAEVELLRQRVREAREAEEEVDRLKRRLREAEDQIAALRSTISTLQGGTTA